MNREMQYKQTQKLLKQTTLKRFSYPEKHTVHHASCASQQIIGSKHWKTGRHWDSLDLLNSMLYRQMDSRIITSTLSLTTAYHLKLSIPMTLPARSIRSSQVILTISHSSVLYTPVNKHNIFFLLSQITQAATSVQERQIQLVIQTKTRWLCAKQKYKI